MKSADVSGWDVDQDGDRERTRANQEADPESGGSVPSLVITGATEQVSRDRKAWWEIMFPLIYIHWLHCSALTPSVPKVPSLFRHSQVDFLLHICRLCSLFKRCLWSASKHRRPDSFSSSICLFLLLQNHPFPSYFPTVLSVCGFIAVIIHSRLVSSCHMLDLRSSDCFHSWIFSLSLSDEVRSILRDQLQLSKFKTVFSFRLSPSYFCNLPTSEVCLCVFLTSD